MPNFTQKAIKESFIKLLNDKPLHQITVKDIVEDCGVNRNTFYYHFTDIPTLLQEIIIEEARTYHGRVSDHRFHGTMPGCGYFLCHAE